MSRQADIDRVWEIIGKVGVCMLTTRFAGGLRARPLEARPERDTGLIWFVTDLHSSKEQEIETEHDVALVFIDAKEKAYLSITARAEVMRDHAKAAQIWKRTDDAWWNGPNDPDVCVLRVRPLTAELWDGPASSAVAAYEFAKARVTGDEPNLGENRKITVKMLRVRPDRRRSNRLSNPPSPTYRVLWHAIRARKQVTCTYRGNYREFCPTILGYKKDGREAVLVFQFGGESTNPLPNWRCFDVAGLKDIQQRDGPWHGGSRHSSAQVCVHFVDVDANIPGTLNRSKPLPFGSFELRPPRQPGEPE
jgi:general stress protein 26